MLVESSTVLAQDFTAEASMLLLRARLSHISSPALAAPICTPVLLPDLGMAGKVPPGRDLVRQEEESSSSSGRSVYWNYTHPPLLSQHSPQLVWHPGLSSSQPATNSTFVRHSRGFTESNPKFVSRNIMEMTCKTHSTAAERLAEPQTMAALP